MPNYSKEHLKRIGHPSLPKSVKVSLAWLNRTTDPEDWEDILDEIQEELMKTAEDKNET